MPALIHDLMISAARVAPDRDAVVCAKDSITYSGLVERAGKVVSWLQKSGASKGDRVGLLVDKNVDCYAGLYGIMMAGCAYVPLDRRAPADRLGYIIKDCGITTLVSTVKGFKALEGSADALSTVENIVLMDADETPDVADCNVITRRQLAETDASEPAHVVDTDLAYILYTSGSTGRPKGVMISHAVSMSFVRWAAAEAGVVSNDRVSGHAPLHFDLSTFDIFATAKAGATLYPVPEGASTFPSRLTDWMINNEISVWYSVPSILSMMAKQAKFEERSFKHLKTLIFAGEVFPAKYLRMWLKQCPGVSFKNWYGPTETNVITGYTVDVPADSIDRPVPIGKATDSADLFRVDEDDNIIDDPSVVGELLARGPCVAIGYWGDEEKTRDKFISNAQQDWLRDRVYRTGDLVTMDEHGNFIYQGRVDHQVKCRGYRIELGEIETALYSDQSVQEAAVIPVPDDVIGNRLYAFVASKNGDETVSDSVMNGLKGALPHYMIPDKFIVMNELPKTSNGKIDRQTLSKQAVKAA